MTKQGPFQFVSFYSDVQDVLIFLLISLPSTKHDRVRILYFYFILYSWNRILGVCKLKRATLDLATSPDASCAFCYLNNAVLFAHVLVGSTSKFPEWPFARGWMTFIVLIVLR